MKSLTSIFLLSVFTLYLGGMQLLYWVKVDNAKQKAISFIQNHSTKESETRDFEFSRQEYNSLTWLEKNKEFTYQGVHYDISSINYTSGNIVVKCYTDNEETEIVNAFNQYTNKLFSNHQQSNSTDNDIISKITKEYIPLSLYCNFSSPVKATTIFTNVPQFLISSPISDIWHPPAIC
jgi:hypothetical protein